MTLGLPYNRLACSEEHAVDDDGHVEARAHGHIVNLDRAQGKRRWEFDSYASSGSSSSGDDLWETGGGIEVDVTSAGAEPAEPATERCRGRLLPISKAPPYLRSIEWCARAEYSDQTRKVHEEWVEKQPWIPDVEDASDAQVSVVEDIIADRDGRFDPGG